MNRLIDSIRRVKKTFRTPDLDGDPGPELELEGRRVLLVYTFDALGDTALLGPVIAALAEGGAKGKIGVLAPKNACRVLKLLDLPIDRIELPDSLRIPPPEVDPEAPWQTAEVLEAAEALTEKLQKKRFDVAVDLSLRASVDSRRWLTACGAEVRLGWTPFGTGSGPRPGDALTWGTEDVRHLADRHWSRLMMLPLRGLGVTHPRFDVAFTVPERAFDKAEQLFESARPDRQNGSNGPRVVLVPGSRDPNKRWDPERFERLGRWVTEEAEGAVVVVGAPNEAKLVRGLVKAIGAGATGYANRDLAALVALLSRAHAVVTNDTGPMHFAFLAKTPTVAIFNQMSPVCWGPPQTDPRFVVLRVPDTPGADADGVYTRAALHYLDTLLGKFPGGGR